VACAPDADAAHAFVRAIRDEMPDATHHCWAFVAGPPGSALHIGMSDDGEPHGTAGRPMLEGLLHGGVGEIVAVCTRYYGGVKLGTGGLSRAYAGGVALALETLPTEEKVERSVMDLVVGYPDVDAVQRLVEELELVVLGEEFGLDVRLRLGVPVDRIEELKRRVADRTRGTGRIRAEPPDGPGATDQELQIEGEAPQIEDEAPRVEGETPRIEDEAPRVEGETPRIEDEAPRVADETPRRDDEDGGPPRADAVEEGGDVAEDEGGRP